MEDALNATGAETIVVLNRFYEKVKSIQSRTSLKRVIAGRDSMIGSLIGRDVSVMRLAIVTSQSVKA